MTNWSGLVNILKQYSRLHSQFIMYKFKGGGRNFGRGRGVKYHILQDKVFRVCYPEKCKSIRFKFLRYLKVLFHS